MKNERRETMQDSDVRSLNPAQQQQIGDRNREAREHRDRRGPFTSTARWLGGAFNCSHIDKREAEERRSRNM